MSKYSNLTLHLASLNDSVWRASFDEVAQVLRFPLPRSAYTYPAWWANQSGPGHTQSHAWQGAGWKTAELDLENRMVTFRYDSGEPEALREEQAQSAVKELSIAQAKAGLAAFFKVREEQIEITIRG